MKTVGTRLIPIAKIDSDDFQTREQSGRATEMVPSLRSTGQLHPITVRAKGERFQVIAGHTRLRASGFAGAKEIECKVVDVDDREAWVIAATENISRTDLTPIEKERVVAQVWKLGGWTSQKQMAFALGIHPSYACRLLAADEFRKQPEVLAKNLNAKISTSTIDDTAPLRFPRLRAILLKMVEVGEVSPNRVRTIARALADKASALTKLDDTGVRTFFLHPQREFDPDRQTEVAGNENEIHRPDLIRAIERLAEIIEREPDDEEKNRAAEYGVNLLSRYLARPEPDVEPEGPR